MRTSSVATAACLAALSSYQPVLVRADDAINSLCEEAVDSYGRKITALRTTILPDNDRFTSYSDVEGKWLLVSSGGNNLTQTVWTSGMVAGMFWYQFELTGDPLFQEFAEQTQLGLEGVELLDDNDIGFQVMNSFGLGWRMVGNTDFEERVFAGAKNLYDRRWRPLMSAFLTWTEPSSRPDWKQAVNVDMIMNMEIMLWAATYGGNTSYSDAAADHADLTWKDLVRDDNSTFHVADYSLEDGSLLDQGTYQGYANDSTWTRGQGWAFYGFTMVYRFLQEPKYLSYAEGTLKYFDESIRRADGIPYSDFDAPINDLNPTDSSALAIVCSGLFELFHMTGKPEHLEMAQEYRLRILDNPDYFDPTETTEEWEPITHGGAAAWGDNATGSVTGDYYDMEGLARYKMIAPSIILRNQDAVVVTGGATGAAYFAVAALNDVDVSGLHISKPVIIRFGVTLSNTDNVPKSLLIEGLTLTVKVAIAAPDDGWTAGVNTVTFSVPGGTFESVVEVEGVAVVFTNLVTGGTTEATVDHLILSHNLVTSLGTCAYAGEECSAPGDCCDYSCDAESGTCCSGLDECASGSSSSSSYSYDMDFDGDDEGITQTRRPRDGSYSLQFDADGDSSAMDDDDGPKPHRFDRARGGRGGH